MMTPRPATDEHRIGMRQKRRTPLPEERALVSLSSQGYLLEGCAYSWGRRPVRTIADGGGIPLGLLLTGLFLASLVSATAFVAYEIGDVLVRWLTPSWVASSMPGPIVRSIVGALALSLAMSLPWVGWIVQIAVVIVGLGAFLLERFQFRQELRTAGLA
jgi:hypothetical protein